MASYPVVLISYPILEAKAEDDELREMRVTFEEHLAFLTTTTHDAISDRDRLLKHWKGIPDPEIYKANRILERHLNNTGDICKVIDAVYATGRTIEDRRGMIRKNTIYSTSQKGENRRIRKMHKRIKEVRQIVAWTENEIHRRRVKRKATKKEKENVQTLRKWADMELRREKDLKYVKEKALDELNYLTKLIRTKLRDDRTRYNRMFREDEGMFYRKTQRMSEKKGKIPHIVKFEEFWAGIWEDESKTPHRKWMSTITQKIRAKVVDVQEFTITQEKMYSIVKSRKKWSPRVSMEYKIIGGKS